MGTRNSSTEEVMQYHFFNEKRGEKEFVSSYVYTNVASVGAHPSYEINFKKTKRIHKNKCNGFISKLEHLLNTCYYQLTHTTLKKRRVIKTL